MRVLFLVGTLGAGGLERFTTRMTIRAKQGGEFEPLVCCLREREGIFLSSLEREAIEVYEAPAQWMRHPKQFVKFKNLIQEIDPAIVHSQVNFSLGQQFLAVRMAGRATFCVTERNQYPLHGGARIRRILQFYFLRWLGAHYSANGMLVAEHLARQVYCSVSSIPVLPNGVNDILPDPSVRTRLRQILGWGTDDVGIGYIARMAPVKQHDKFLEVLGNLREQNLPVKACLVGDGPERTKLEQLVHQLNLEDYVTFTGRIANVEDYLQAFDLVAHFSLREGMPNAILEAMSAGKPIVATGVGAIPELLDEGRVGILIKEPTLDNLMTGLRSLIQSPELQVRLGHMASLRVQQIYGLEAIYKRLLHYYEGVRSS